MDSFISKPQYDFEAKTTNIINTEEMKVNVDKIKVGKTICINTENDTFISPILLELHINYFDDSDFNMVFTTNYKRKPEEFRFADLYSTISQTSVSDKTFTFDE